LDAGYTVISFDGPGHFNSTVKQTNLVHFSNVIAEIVRRENIEVILAHSFGGASSVVALHGNDLPSVKKLVLMGSPNRLINVIDTFASMMKFTKENKRDFINYLNKRFKRDIETVAVETYLQKLSVETLIVHDSLDRIVPYSAAVSVAAHNPNALLFTTEKAGHYKMLWNELIKKRVAEFVGKADNGAWEYDKLHLFKRAVNKN
jgi:pimeloyl-ACP methyl ester carboxylesterase